MDLPIRNGGSLHSYVCSPEGISPVKFFFLTFPASTGAASIAARQRRVAALLRRAAAVSGGPGYGAACAAGLHGAADSAASGGH